MFTDEYGNEFVVTQNLYDTLELSRAAHMEELLNLSGKASFQEAMETLTTMQTRHQAEQMMACVNAVGNLESRLIGLLRHLDVGEFEISSFDAQVVPVNPDTSETE